MKYQIVNLLFYVIEIITIISGISFVVYHMRNKNIMFRYDIFLFCFLCSLTSVLIVAVEKPVSPLLICLGILIIIPSNLFPIMFNTIFYEDYFIKTTFFFKKNYYYKDITSCGYAYGYKIGHIFSFSFGRFIEIRYTAVTNRKRFIALACKNYRKLHNGEEIPGLEAFPGYANFAEVKIPEPDFSLSESTPIRPADMTVRKRILIESEADSHKIIYRAGLHGNEFIIDGYVYGEYKKFFETSHELSANVSGHKFAAGFDSKTAQSYITVDDRIIASKTRYI